MKKPHATRPSLGTTKATIFQGLENLSIPLPVKIAAKWLPAGWRLMKLGEVCDAVRGVTFPSGEAANIAFEDSIACLTTSGVQDTPAWDSRRFIPRSRVRDNQQLLRPFDLLVSTANSRALVGKSCIIENIPFQCSFGTFVTVLRPKNIIEPSLLACWMRLPDVLGQFITVSSNTTNISNLRVSDLLAIEIPLPPLPEQQRIVAVLREQMAAVAAARCSAAEQLKTVTKLEWSYRHAAFHNNRPISVQPIPPPVASGWKWQSLRSLAQLESGHTPSRYHPEWWGGKTSWLALPDIRALDGQMVLETTECTNALGIQNSSARILPAGTVCLSRTASVGFVTIMGKAMATSQDFANWVCGPELDPSFLMHALIAARPYLHSLSSGAIHKTIYMPTLKEFHICAPAIANQRRIASRLTTQMAEVEKLRKSLTEQLAAIMALPSALLRRAFNGEI
jgi:type I restriction enzyme S subunit